MNNCPSFPPFAAPFCILALAASGLLVSSCGDRSVDWMSHVAGPPTVSDLGPDDRTHIATGEEASGSWWYQGSFRCLREKTGSLVDYVDGITHPDSYAVPSSARRADFERAFDAMLDAVVRELDGNAGTEGNWCDVRKRMTTAGYELLRFHDSATGRYFLVGRDVASGGRQAHFVVNPYAKRNLVVEAPHDGADAWTGSQGIRVFQYLAARAFVMNGAGRCASGQYTGCDGRTSACIDGPALEGHRRSDVAHDEDNLLHVIHRVFEDRSSRVRFVQLHGFAATADNLAISADGSAVYSNGSWKPRQNGASIAVRFRDKLRAQASPDSSFRSCQADDGKAKLCATTNVQGRYTNGTTADACDDFDTSPSGRFLHVEQARTFRDEDGSDGKDWKDIARALRDTWPACDMNGGTSDCSLGGRHARQPPCTCGVDCPA